MTVLFIELFWFKFNFNFYPPWKKRDQKCRIIFSKTKNKKQKTKIEKCFSKTKRWFFFRRIVFSLFFFFLSFVNLKLLKNFENFFDKSFLEKQKQNKKIFTNFWITKNYNVHFSVKFPWKFFKRKKNKKNEEIFFKTIFRHFFLFSLQKIFQKKFLKKERKK